MKGIVFALARPAIIERMKSPMVVSVLLAMLLSLGLITAAYAAEHKLTAGDGAEGDRFGDSVSISGDYAIVGAHHDDDNGSDSGSAYIFNRSGITWTQQAKLTAGDGAEGDRFGDSVSISGDYAIVGAHHDDDNGSDSGSAYIFNRSGITWTQQPKLTAGDGALGDHFGVSVSISGVYAIVGAHHDDDNRSDSGSAYIYDALAPTPTITAVNPNEGNQGEILAAVTITGTYFTGATSVSFGSGITVNDFSADSSTQITATISINGGATLGTRDVSVTTPSGTGTLTDGFTVNEPTVTLPDLVVSSVSQEWIEEGLTYNVTFTICNTGSSGAGASVAGIYIDGSWQQDQAVGALNASQCSGSITVGPFTISGESDTVEVRADKDSAVDESNENNNSQEETFPPVGNGNGGGGCFIATAAYGSYLDSHVETLRDFRDQYLVTNPVGQGLVSAYYKLSPPLAGFIDDHPALKPVVRVGLLPAVAMSTVAVNTTSAEKVAIVGSLALVSVALAAWLSRRRGKGVIS